MNPLLWKREHQIALVCAIALGGLIGMILGFFVTPHYVSFRWGKLWCDYGYNCIYLLQGYWLLILFWTSIGGLVGGGLVYVRQLLRT
jgi:hypothetical protein